MNLAPLAEVTRGGQIESLHAGAVAVVDSGGKLLYYAGDADFPTFTRSTLKPFQALPFMRGGGVAHFGFGSREIALMCASHSGEPMHVDTVRAMLSCAGCDEHHLRCGCHVPIRYAAADQRPPAGEIFNQLHNNCSGKHAGFLAYCVQHGLPLDTYIDPGHPLQQAIRHDVARIAGLPESGLVSGIDGCSAPNYAMPLSRLALCYARLARGANDREYGCALGPLFDAMTGQPELVSGSGRADLAFMQAAPRDWVVKGGAEGVLAVGVRSAGLGIALKVADGNARALYPAAIAVLRQLALIDAVTPAPLEPWSQPTLRNLRGLVTGDVRATVRLVKA
ncbi:asparaginase [Noviherbaspirillum sp. UKPF54]|uniref:asparaginase n=1 Tax=Noviherbaspirillum sp. UKPF54 TaxID=2601898 RepID=UPI0011B1B013|nr:asparaginase [Noviherbaspirillum sp. UKPF54]QDZ29089.1 asparaginase [Noviherbaspirillum sp. UKPF54]